MTRDHGGNLDWAKATFGGTDWIDLSTGINRVPYPVEVTDNSAWTALPGQGAQARLLQAAREAYRTEAPLVALAGAQAAIQLIPCLGKPGLARIVSPTYNEHAACLLAQGWRVEAVADITDLPGADLAVVVNPNNPDGRFWQPQALLNLLPQVGRLVVDESFADPVPELSLAPQAGREGLLILRSFGKFYGLAGLRLGFALGSQPDIARLAGLSGPWPVPGVALEIGARALADAPWALATTARLSEEARQMDAIAASFGWQPVGGTHLFRTYASPDAPAAQSRLAQARIWSRIFPWSPQWIRLGLPGTPEEWSRLAAA